MTDNINVLIVDDTPVNIKVIQKYLEPKGFNVTTAENGKEAIAIFLAKTPDLILMDVMMPEMDGYEATQKIRQLEPNKWVPIIFLSAKSTVDDQIMGIEAGGDDYLTKPVDLRMLQCKINSMMRIVNMQKKLANMTNELDNYAQSAADEMELAGQLMQNMSYKFADKNVEQVKIYLNAAENISGDIAITQKHENRLYVLLADATGHGLAAAISLIPVTHTFHRMIKEGYNISAIANSMNESLRELLPADRFVAATLAMIDQSNQIIEIWNGSNPKPVLVDKDGVVIKSFDRSNFALGIVGNELFSGQSEIVFYPVNSELLLYTDGLIDSVNRENENFGYERLEQSIKKASDSQSDKNKAFDSLIQEINAYIDADNRVDDISLLSVQCETTSM